MYKRSRQTLKAVIATTVIAGIVGAAQFKSHALTSDELYVRAYQATVNAVNTKTQKSINNARAAIEALKGTGASFAIGEFSKQVDQIQHPFLVNIVGAIDKARETYRQADINAARAFLDPDLPQEWKNAYSSAIDAIQQELVKGFIDAYHVASVTGLPEDVEIFNDMLSELKLASDPSIGAWAEEFTKPMSSVWNNAELISIRSTVEEISTELKNYTVLKLSEDGSKVYSEAYSEAYVDSNKSIRSIWSINEGYINGMYYSNNKLIFIGDIVADESGEYIHEIFFKDGKLEKWIVQEYSDSKIKDIKVYDESNLPQNLQNKLSEYKQNSNSLFSNALGKITK